MPIRVLVEDREIGAQAQVATVLTQHVGREAMERRGPSPAAARAEQFRDSSPHLLGGLGGERERQDPEALFRGLLNEPSHAHGQHSSLARPRPCKHQHGAVVPLDGSPLVAVQRLQIEHGYAPASSKALFRILDSASGTGVSSAVIRAAASEATSGLLYFFGSAFRTSVQ